jgi:hypothetical protein
MVQRVGVDELQNAGRVQLLIYGVALIVSSIATASSIANPGSSRLWVGGFLVAGYAAYKAARIYFALFQLRPVYGSEAISKLDFGLLSVAIGLLVVVATTLLPEYTRVNSPTTGTCWAESTTNSESLVPIACWSDDAIFQTVKHVTNPLRCPYDDYLEVKSSDGNYACLGLP